MKDGIIKGNGASRYLKTVPSFLDLYPTYEEFAAAFVKGELPVDFNGINPDGWSQLGDNLGKATLLKDTTAALYGLDETATPDEVFAAALPARFDPKIGDILATTSVDLGEEWALCNGDYVANADYPELTGNMPNRYGYKKIDGRSIYRIVYADGMWVACGSAIPAGLTKTYPAIFTTSDPGGEWNVNIITDATGCFYDIAYHDGTWVAVGTDASSGSIYSSLVGVIYTATDPAGEWTKKHSAQKSMYTGVSCSDDGVWVVCGGCYYSNNTTKMRVTHSSNNFQSISSQETSFSIYSTISDTIFPRIANYEGQWVIVYSDTSNYTSILTTTDITSSSSWTNNTIGASSNGYRSPKNIAVYDGTWIIICYGSSSIYTSSILYTTDPKGTWKATSCYVESNRNTFMYDIAFNSITKEYVVTATSNDRIVTYTFDNLSNINPKLHDWNIPIDEDSFIPIAISPDGVEVIAGVSTDRIATIVTTEGSNLPVVSVGNAYCYIKVKE